MQVVPSCHLEPSTVLRGDGPAVLTTDASFQQTMAQVRGDLATAPPAGLDLLHSTVVPAHPVDAVLATPPAPPRPNPLEGLKPGDRDSGPAGSVARLQRILRHWNQRLDVRVTGTFDAATADALTLYKAVYQTDTRSTAVDGTTGKYLLQMEDGTFWNHPPSKTGAGTLLYQASRDLGIPYRLGGNGHSSTDCAMLVRRALIHAGVADPSLSRLADAQYACAEKGEHGLHLRHGEPQPGDLVFFHNPTFQSALAYHGITHVGLYLGHGKMLAASSSHGKVLIQSLGGLSRHVAGYARVIPRQGAAHEPDTAGGIQPGGESVL